MGSEAAAGAKGVVPPQLRRGSLEGGRDQEFTLGRVASEVLL